MGGSGASDPCRMPGTEIQRPSSSVLRNVAMLLAVAALLLLLPTLTSGAQAKPRKSGAHHTKRVAHGSSRHFDRLDRRATRRVQRPKTKSSGGGKSNNGKTTGSGGGSTSGPGESTTLPTEASPAPTLPPAETSPLPPAETSPAPETTLPPTETTVVTPPSTSETTTTPPTTESSPSPELLFSGSRISSFWLNQSAPGAVTEVPDPAGGPRSVFKMTVADTDVYPITPTENPRAQLMSPPTIQPSDEIWWHSSFYLPAEFPSSVPGWLNLLEGPYGAPFNGSPPWQIQVVGNYIQWTRNKTYGYDVPWRMPLTKEKWVDVLVHERFGSSGWVEMWIDGQPITFFPGGTYNPSRLAPTTHLNMATMDSSNNGGPNSIILQSYRQVGMFSSVSVFEGPLQIGRSRASVGG